MKIQSIPLKNLLVNRANDRHGELVDEGAAIEWLLKHRGDHMRNLARDIVGEGGIYEPPLVHRENSDFVVYDGNRRVTCLKLLQKPEYAPSASWRDFFQGLRKRWIGKLPDKVMCHVEADRDRIDEILYRRHTGGQSGIGRSQWNAEAKSYFVRRTGKKTKVNVAEEIEKKLKESGHLKESVKVPWSNLNRLLSSETFRNRVGISVKKNHMELTHDQTRVMAALTRIASDLAKREIVLDDIWDNKGKKAYLDLLETENLLPSALDSLPTNRNFKSLKPVPAKSATATVPSKRAKPLSRKTLIRPEIDYGIMPQVHNQRALDIWNELQHNLKFGEHDNAIAVLFRILVEFAVENYIERAPVTTVHVNDKLAKKFRKAIDYMKANNIIDKNYFETLKKFEHAETILSANTMHKYVHHKNFFPSDHHLRSMWDSLSIFIIECMKK